MEKCRGYLAHARYLLALVRVDAAENCPRLVECSMHRPPHAPTLPTSFGPPGRNWCPVCFRWSLRSSLRKISRTSSASRANTMTSCEPTCPTSMPAHALGLQPAGRVQTNSINSGNSEHPFCPHDQARPLRFTAPPALAASSHSFPSPHHPNNSLIAAIRPHVLTPLNPLPVSAHVSRSSRTTAATPPRLSFAPSASG